MTQRFAAFLDSHTAQLRAEVFDLLQAKPLEYTEDLMAVIYDIRHEESEHKRILGMLADIGFLEVFARAAEVGDL